MVFSLARIFGRKETGNEIDKRLINVKLSLKGQNNPEQIEGTLELPQETQQYRDSPFEGKVMGYEKVKNVFGKKPFLTRNQAEFKNKLNTMFKQGQNMEYYQNVEQKFSQITNQHTQNYDEQLNRQEKFRYLTGKIDKNPQEVMQMFRGKYDVKSSVQKVKNLTRVRKKDYKFDIKAMNRINVQKGLSMFGDADKDGVMNVIDCEPLNKFKQGKIHDMLGVKPEDAINQKELERQQNIGKVFSNTDNTQSFYDVGSLNYINKQIMELEKKIEQEKDPKIKRALIEQKNELYKQYRHIYDIERKKELKNEVSYPDYLKAQTEYQKAIELLPLEKRAKQLEVQKQREELKKQKQLAEQEKEFAPVKTLAEYKKVEAQEQLNKLQLAKAQKDIELAKAETRLKMAEAKKTNSQANQLLYEDKLNKFKKAVTATVGTGSNPERIKNLFSINKSSDINKSTENIVRSNIEQFVGQKKNSLDTLRSVISTGTSYPLNSVPPKTIEQTRANRAKVEALAGGMFKNTGLSPEKAIFAKKQAVTSQGSLLQGGILQTGVSQADVSQAQVSQDVEQSYNTPILSQQDFGVQTIEQYPEQYNEQSVREQSAREQYARDIVAGNVNYEDIDWDNVSIDDIEKIDPQYAEYLKNSAGKHKYRRGPYKKKK